MFVLNGALAIPMNAWRVDSLGSNTMDEGRGSEGPCKSKPMLILTLDEQPVHSPTMLDPRSFANV